MSKVEIENKIAELESNIALHTTKIECTEEEITDARLECENFELDESEYEEQYQEMLDCEGTVTVCGMEFDPSRILEELDPTAYRCGLSDFTSSLDKENNEEYKELEEVHTELEERLDEETELLDEMETELEEMQEELSELEEEDEE